ncbi:MAG: competence/damage-inducible protein A [Clostridia bacterium]|nr:competence/damage-inducible protein A [Clostridia bacterium]
MEVRTEASGFSSAEILCVGTELLLGDIVNTNAAFLSRALAALGIPVYRQTVVGDNPRRLRQALSDALLYADLVITSGGLGPTYDDLTKETVAAFFGRQTVLHEESLERIRAYFARTNREMPENNVKQAMVPEGATVFPNDYGTAPAFALTDDVTGKTVIMLPGPPRELEPIFEEQIAPYLRSRSDEVLLSKNIHLFGIGESQAEGYVRTLMEESVNPTLAPYCQAGEVRFRVTARAKDEKSAAAMCDKMIAQVRASGLQPYIYGIDVHSLEEAAIRALLKRELTVAVAESLTGGMIGERLASVPGASGAFLGGCITYRNAVKQSLLGVSFETLDRYTEISAECAREMAIGVLERLGSDIGVSATGLAGPGGGTPECPVGTVYIGIAMKTKGIDGKAVLSSSVRRLALSPMRDRAYIRTVSASNAIELVLRAAENGGIV